MLTVEQALHRILADVPRQPAEDVPLAEAYGRVLAADVVSRVAVPPWDNSAMDGYAVRAADTPAPCGCSRWSARAPSPAGPSLPAP